MTKVGIVISIVGSIITIIGFILKYMDNKAVTIIGGADGPTSIFLAGKVGNETGMIEIVFGLIILVFGFMIIRRKR